MKPVSENQSQNLEVQKRSQRKGHWRIERILLIMVIILQAVIIMRLFKPELSNQGQVSLLPDKVTPKRSALQPAAAPDAPALPAGAGLAFSSATGAGFTEEELSALLRSFLHSGPGGIADPDVFAILDHHLNHAVSAHRQMDRFFNRVRHDFMELDSLFNIDEGWPMLAPSPTLDMRELDTHYLVTFSLPGLQADDVGVRIDGRILTVLCDTDAAGGHRYEGRVQLPGPVNLEEQPRASLTNGCLKVLLPKRSVLETSPDRKSLL